MNLLEDAEFRKKQINKAYTVYAILKYKLRNSIPNDIFFSKSDSISLNEFEFNNNAFILKIKTKFLPPLIIEFRERNRTILGYDPDSKHITLNILPEINGKITFTAQIANFIINNEHFEHYFIHEVIHWLDDIRTKSKIRYSNVRMKEKEYYNSDSELNAYTLELIEYIYRQIRYYTIKTRENMKDYLKEVINSKDFIEQFSEFLTNLNETNYRKVIKRVYDYFYTHLSNYITEGCRIYERYGTDIELEKLLIENLKNANID